MGESIFEGTITKWLKKPGDKIQRDEPLFEISTDKVDAEIPAPASGVLQEIKVSEGNTVQVNTVVGVMGTLAALPHPPRQSCCACPFPLPRRYRQRKKFPAPRPASRPALRGEEDSTYALRRSSASSLASTTWILKSQWHRHRRPRYKQDVLNFVENRTAAPLAAPASRQTSPLRRLSFQATLCDVQYAPRSSRAHD